MNISQILRFPIKSLSGQGLTQCCLTPGQGLPFDRHWALARPDGDAADNAAWHPKSHFLVLVREHELALFKTHFDDATLRLNFDAPGGLHGSAKLDTQPGRDAIAAAVAKHLGLDVGPQNEGGTPILVEAQDIGYFDTTKGPISLLNMESVRALEKLLSRQLDPLRFRMNLVLEGVPAWAEMDWPVKRVKIGDTVLEFTQITGRCKATHVNPGSGELDVKILHALKEHFGHTQMGIYAEVVQGGDIKAGDALTFLD